MKTHNNRVDIKVVIVGNMSVGKTSLIQRFIHEKFKENMNETIGAAFSAKEMTSMNGSKRIVGIWDTAGTERYRSMVKMFYRDAKAAIVCFDITNKSSWEGLRSWISELREVEEHCKVYICGTKKDLIDEGISEREVPLEKCNEYAKGIQVKLMETSSKTGENVGELFQSIVDECVLDESITGKSSLQLAENDKRRMCC
ncbi:ras-related protein Rab-24 isoform X1 [Halyomorpha halys]|uniref:ras-related protein Rab-24 isoform X1 n=2 Tax=Halyomorpha halys TaxID=286706 RepID=UPI0006D51D7D|nr:ras-related protein Rab-24-like isoform X1 [Halyomorpha halys]